MQVKPEPPTLNDRLDGQVAVVTGGGRGIGRAICIALARQGATVVIAEKDQCAAEATSGLLGDGRGSAVETDVSSEESVLRLYASVEARYGALDVLVNNAGVFSATPIQDITVAEWDKVQSVNLRGTFLMSREALRLMAPHRCGRIINIASLSAKTGGLAAGAHYAASKAGVVALTKALAMQAAPHGITVNAIAPGIIETDLTRAWDESTRSSLRERIPLHTFGQPEDIAEMVAFLASDRGRHITGEIIDINGGILMD